MTHKVYVVTDLGPGDGGKGGVVHKIATMMNPHTIIKVGGAQGSHGVSASCGLRFAFSQWGCGSFEGTATHLSSRFVVSPEGLLNEAKALKGAGFLGDPFDLLTIDDTCVCATPYHGIASRLKELARGKNPRGTIGTGVGEAYRMARLFPELTIAAGDLHHADLKNRLAAIRERIKRDLEEVLSQEFLPEDREEMEEEAALLVNDDFLDHVTYRFETAGQLAHIVPSCFFERQILTKKGVAAVESSHGVLTDERYGFHPHTSALRTLPRFTEEMLRGVGYTGQIVNIGVTRAYQIRHGAGPMPTADPSMNENLLPGSSKDTNRYQGEVRVGPLDLMLLRYAIEVCGGLKAFDGLAITWFDQIGVNGNWLLCDRYQDMNNGAFFQNGNALRVFAGVEEERFTYQAKLGAELTGSVPVVSTYPLPTGATRDELFSFCADILEKSVGVPVRLVSFGPTERDKICR